MALRVECAIGSNHADISNFSALKFRSLATREQFMPTKEYKDLKKFKENRLNQNETVVSWGQGYIGDLMGSGKNRQFNGVLIVTTQRVVFYSKGWISEVFEEIPLNKISSVFSKKIMSHTTLTIHTSGNDLIFKSLVPAEAEDLQSKLNALKDEKPSSKDTVTDPLVALEKLGALYKSGVLTEAEFQEKKQDLLKKVA
jgi:hypothetical protein